MGTPAGLPSHLFPTVACPSESPVMLHSSSSCSCILCRSVFHKKTLLSQKETGREQILWRLWGLHKAELKQTGVGDLALTWPQLF